MSDKELIILIASVWRAHGGDAEGFLYTWRKIYSEILTTEEEEEK